MLQALLSVAPVRGELDRAALAVHSTMLEHGFVCVGTAEPSASAAPVLAAAPDGSISMQLVPAGWNSVADSYTFGYVHPLRESTDTFTIKALAIGSSLAVHAASSSAGADLLNLTINVETSSVDNDPVSVVARAKEWQEKAAAGIAQRLLGRQNSTARLGKALEAHPSAAAGSDRKRPEPEDPRPARPARPDFDNDYERDRRPFPGAPLFRDPFRPGFFGEDRPVFWTPDGGLLGPRHPAWGQVIPGRTGGGMMPRFDPIGPGTGEPNPDLFVPGIGGIGGPDGLPTFIGGAGGRGRGRMDPDGMFMM
eukprot:TRINITY_DN68667_c0_g1_i1.p1 TRINITY_DN68667_c0_g1~~TRINITY_DN68667_c0_g1_i1.p1  ORF type:complete len:308 (-),score=55.22 TRINITY_DN68667_c0_g1_i1:97-1020(-)